MPLRAAPELATGMKPVHVPSGVGVLPIRTLRAPLVPVGVVAVHVRLPQATGALASMTRDVNVPVAAYGVMRIQSTCTAPPPTFMSLISGFMLLVMAIACEATCVPSMKYVTLVEVQSIRKSCAAPSHEAPSGVSIEVAPAVRAYSWPPLPVLNAAHGGALKLLSKPMC